MQPARCGRPAGQRAGSVRQVIIREMRTDEQPLVGELRVTAYQALRLLSEGSDYAGTLRRFGFDGDFTVLVAVDDAGEIAGTITFEPFGPHSELARDPATFGAARAHAQTNGGSGSLDQG